MNCTIHRLCHAALAVLVMAPVTGIAPGDAVARAADSAQQLLDVVATAGAGRERVAAAAELAELGAPAIPVLTEFLGRTRSSSEGERRAVLAAINADVPDKKGRFRTPKGKQKVDRGDDFDWLGELAKLDLGLPGLGDVFADVAAIRALAGATSVEAGAAILDFGFSEVGAIYRDECGRYLRKMAPHSLPALIVTASNRRKSRSLRRYAAYQLDRLDRQDPNKALEGALFDRNLLLAVIRAYGTTKQREAFAPLLGLADHPVAEIREAARQSLMAYVTGREPPPAPKRKLTLPGGKLSEEEVPLWLTYRELADIELRRTYREVFGKRARGRTRPAKLARALFEFYDARRAERHAAAYAEASALAQAGKWADAAAAFDRLLAQVPDHPERATIAPIYYQHAQLLAREGSWQQAAEAYSKAHGLDPDAEFAREALASHHFAVGKALEAAGKDGSAAFRQARESTPGDTRLSAQITERAQPPGRWMLYVGIAGGAGGLILLILGLAVRRR
ncbi:MAG: hypothetical protein MJE77_19015 [Proteobacteria bacterium]|nr:hypothetical protein [Pseudomonadota bacterium]